MYGGSMNEECGYSNGVW